MHATRSKESQQQQQQRQQRRLRQPRVTRAASRATMEDVSYLADVQQVASSMAVVLGLASGSELTDVQSSGLDSDESDDEQTFQQEVDTEYQTTMKSSCVMTSMNKEQEQQDNVAVTHSTDNVSSTVINHSTMIDNPPREKHALSMEYEAKYRSPYNTSRRMRRYQQRRCSNKTRNNDENQEASSTHSITLTPVANRYTSTIQTRARVMTAAEAIYGFGMEHDEDEQEKEETEEEEDEEDEETPRASLYSKLVSLANESSTVMEKNADTVQETLNATLSPLVEDSAHIKVDRQASHLVQSRQSRQPRSRPRRGIARVVFIPQSDEIDMEDNITKNTTSIVESKEEEKEEQHMSNDLKTTSQVLGKRSMSKRYESTSASVSKTTIQFTTSISTQHESQKSTLIQVETSTSLTASVVPSSTIPAGDVVQEDTMQVDQHDEESIKSTESRSLGEPDHSVAVNEDDKSCSIIISNTAEAKIVQDQPDTIPLAVDEPADENTTTTNNKNEEIEEEEEVEEEEESSDYNGPTYRGERAEIAHINECFPLLAQQYRLLRKIGEGTFSVVFKAKDLLGRTLKENRWQLPPSALRYMAIKCIHISSSPSRIHSELSKLNALRQSPSVAPMLDAFRYEDHVAIVLPYIKHDDFKKFYTGCNLDDVRHYMYSLLQSLKDTHRQGIVHRDVKPTNFLYDIQHRRGFLVDFGLAQFVDTSKPIYPPTPATLVGTPRTEDNRLGYLLRDNRPVVRADRAGTRGFRPPEVLLKVEHQTTALDMWAAGVILLCFLTGRYPFFNSSSDAEALLEITCIQGQIAMKNMAVKYHRSFHCNIPGMRNNAAGFARLIQYLNEDRPDFLDTNAVDLLEKLLKVDPAERITASDALSHPFFA